MEDISLSVTLSNKKNKLKNIKTISQHKLHQVQDTFVSGDTGHLVHFYGIEGPGNLPISMQSLLTEQKLVPLKDFERLGNKQRAQSDL